jgi:hypothetical protein
MLVNTIPKAIGVGSFVVVARVITANGQWCALAHIIGPPRSVKAL